MTPTFFVTFLAATTLTEAFVPLPTFTHARARIRLAMSAEEDAAIAQLQAEYSSLQASLLNDLQEHKMDEAKDISQEMFEKAVDINALKKYQQQEKLSEANEHLQHALGDLEQAQALQDQARGDAAWSEDEASMVESLDAGYEDLERLRDLSVSHAAHQLEEDCRDQVVEATFQELKAESEVEDATELLRMLEENEAHLKAIIQQMREEKNHELKQQWETHHLPKHQEFVDSVRKVMKAKLIDHDPTKGNVAF